MDLSSESTEDLVQRFAREIALYWELDESLTYAETKCSKDRKDLAQLGVCDAVLNEIESRGKDEMLKLKALLDHPIPGVRLVAAFHLEDLIPEQLEDVYRELMSRPRRANGLPDTYAARAGASLDRILGITKPFFSADDPEAIQTPTPDPPALPYRALDAATDLPPLVVPPGQRARKRRASLAMPPRHTAAEVSLIISPFWEIDQRRMRDLNDFEERHREILHLKTRERKVEGRLTIRALGGADPFIHLADRVGGALPNEKTYIRRTAITGSLLVCVDIFTEWISDEGIPYAGCVRIFEHRGIVYDISASYRTGEGQEAVAAQISGMLSTWGWAPEIT